MAKRHKPQRCGSCWQDVRAPMAKVPTRAGSLRHLVVGWDGVCPTCVASLDQWPFAHQPPSEHPATIPHPDRCSKCRAQMVFAHSARCLDQREGYMAEYKCATCDHRWRTVWGPDRRMDFAYWVANVAPTHPMKDWREQLRAAGAPREPSFREKVEMELERLRNEAALLTRTGASMRPYVKLYQKDDQLAISTNAATEEQFMGLASQALEKVIVESADSADWEYRFRRWLPQLVDLTCSLRGYKAPLVEVQRVMTAGSLGLSEEALVADTQGEQPVATTAPAKPAEWEV